MNVDPDTGEIPDDNSAREAGFRTAIRDALEGDLRIDRLTPIQRLDQVRGLLERAKDAVTSAIRQIKKSSLSPDSVDLEEAALAVLRARAVCENTEFQNKGG